MNVYLVIVAQFYSMLKQNTFHLILLAFNFLLHV